MERQGEHGGGDHGKCGVLRTAPREISDALRYGEVACDTPNANRVHQCSVVAHGRQGKYEGTLAHSRGIPSVLRGCIQGAKEAHVEALLQPPNHLHVWCVFVTAFHAVQYVRPPPSPINVCMLIPQRIFSPSRLCQVAATPLR